MDFFVRKTEPVVVIQEDNSHLWKVVAILFAFPLVIAFLPWAAAFLALRWVWRTGQAGRWIVTALLIGMAILTFLSCQGLLLF